MLPHDVEMYKTGRRAAASLADLGHLVLNTLLYRFGKARDPVVQARLAGVLGEVESRLPPPERRRIAQDFLLVQFQSRSEDVVLAIMLAFRKLQ